MTKYIPAPMAAEMSVALWDLARPASLRTPEDTSEMFRPVQATDGKMWLEVETDFQIVIHPDAVLGDIGPILQAYEDAGDLPAGTVSGLEAYVLAHRGQLVTVYDVFPDFFKAGALDWQGMIDAGWLATDGGGA